MDYDTTSLWMVAPGKLSFNYMKFGEVGIHIKACPRV